MGSLLVLAYPLYAGQLHYDSKGIYVVLAPDEIVKNLLNLGVRTIVVNVVDDKQTPIPLMRSGLTMTSRDKIDITKFDAVWHMFRDPTQPEVAALAAAAPDLFFPKDKPIINSIKSLDRMYKSQYIPILEKHGIGPKIMVEPPGTQWGPCNHSAQVSLDRKLVKTANYNNNRGDYPQREKDMGTIVVEFLDSAVNGQRSFFRVGYSMGKVLPGWMYTSSDDQVVQKTGTCKIRTPHEVPTEHHAVIKRAMDEIGIDLCHIEGLYVNGALKLFDINPYPTTYGTTLKPISDAMAEQIVKHFGW